MCRFKSFSWSRCVTAALGNCYTIHVEKPWQEGLAVCGAMLAFTQARLSWGPYSPFASFWYRGAEQQHPILRLLFPFSEASLDTTPLENSESSKQWFSNIAAHEDYYLGSFQTPFAVTAVQQGTFSYFASMP